MKEDQNKRFEELFYECQVMPDEPLDAECFDACPPNRPLTLTEAIKRVASFNNETSDDVLRRRPRMVSDNVMEDDEDVYLLPNSESHRNVYHIAKYRLGETDWEEHLYNKAWIDLPMFKAFRRIQKDYLKKSDMTGTESRRQ